MEGGSRPVGRPPGSANKPTVPNPAKVAPKKPVTLGKGRYHLSRPFEMIEFLFLLTKLMN